MRRKKANVQIPLRAKFWIWKQKNLCLFVNIQIEGETLGTVSDEDGYFISRTFVKRNTI
jgi:hypothetical protein